MDSKFLKIPLFHNAFLFQLAKTGYTILWGLGDFLVLRAPLVQ